MIFDIWKTNKFNLEIKVAEIDAKEAPVALAKYLKENLGFKGWERETGNPGEYEPYIRETGGRIIWKEGNTFAGADDYWNTYEVKAHTEDECYKDLELKYTEADLISAYNKGLSDGKNN